MNFAKALKIVGVGASMTAGTPGFFSPRERPPHGQGNVESQYAYWMMKLRPSWEVLNRGMRGQRTDQIWMRFDYDVLDNHPQVVIILAGTNDLYQNRDMATPLDYLKRMYERAREHAVTPVACSIAPLNLAEPDLKRRILEFNRKIRGLAENSRTVFCDIYSALEDPGRPGFMMESPDDVHPDVAGYRKMGETLTATVDLLISKGPAGGG